MPSETYGKTNKTHLFPICLVTQAVGVLKRFNTDAICPIYLIYIVSDL